MRWSIGKSQYGQVLEVMDTSWAEYADFLHDAQHIQRDPADKDTSWWVGPFIPFEASIGVHRTNDDVSHMASWIAGDLDHGNWQIDSLRLKLTGCTWLAYTTTQSRYGDQRWRIMTMVDREYTVPEHARLFRWYSHKFDGQLDERCKNPSRIYYLPADWRDADNVWYQEYGVPCKVDSILAMVPEATVDTPMIGAGRDLTAAPDGTRIVTPHMLQMAQSGKEGGRLIKLMSAAAKRCRVNGWTLSAEDLARAALEASSQFAPGKKRPDLKREAQRAIDWAERNFQPQSSLERIRSRILWERERKEANLKLYRTAMSGNDCT